MQFNSFEINYLQEICQFYSQLPYHQWLGLSIENISMNEVAMRFEMKPQFIGNTLKQILHGGVIASALDACGGMHALIHAGRDLKAEPMDEKMERLSQLSTVDMRVDYLAPGEGSVFSLKSTPLRRGQHIAVFRIDLFNERQCHIAAAVASYFARPLPAR